MKTKLFSAIMTAIAVVACTPDPKEDTQPHVDLKVNFTPVSEMTDGLSAPTQYIVGIDGVERPLQGIPQMIEGIKGPGKYFLTVRNDAENVGLDGHNLKVEASAEGVIPSIGWCFAWGEWKKVKAENNTAVDVAVSQITKQMNVTLCLRGVQTENVKKVSSSISNVGSSLDLETGLPMDPATVRALMDQEGLPGDYRNELRFLGTVPAAQNELLIEISLNDGTSKTIPVDVTAKLVTANEDKLSIHECKVTVKNFNEAAEHIDVKWASGKIENVFDPNSVSHIYLDWPAYNDATGLEIKMKDGSVLACKLEKKNVGGNEVLSSLESFDDIPLEEDIIGYTIIKDQDRLDLPVSFVKYKNGTISVDCFLLRTPADLDAVRENLAGNFIQMADMDLAEGFTVIGSEKEPFTGIYDGNGHSLNGIVMHKAPAPAGLFAKNSGQISNLTLGEGTITGNSRLGTIAGINTGRIINCVNNINVSGIETGCGGIVYINRQGGLIQSCVNHGEIKAPNSVGGIASENVESSMIENCLNDGTIGYPENAKGTVGGICGANNTKSEVVGCVNLGKISVPGCGWATGGIVGYHSNSSVIIACANRGDIEAKSSVGGVVGQHNKSIIRSSYNCGKVNANKSEWAVGSFIGSNGAQGNIVEYCWGLDFFGKWAGSNHQDNVLDVTDFNTQWPEENPDKGWGIWSEGKIPANGYWWKSLGSKAETQYPVLYWE